MFLTKFEPDIDSRSSCCSRVPANSPTPVQDSNSKIKIPKFLLRGKSKKHFQAANSFSIFYNHFHKMADFYRCKLYRALNSIAYLIKEQFVIFTRRIFDGKNVTHNSGIRSRQADLQYDTLDKAELL